MIQILKNHQDIKTSAIMILVIEIVHNSFVFFSYHHQPRFNCTLRFTYIFLFLFIYYSLYLTYQIRFQTERNCFFSWDVCHRCAYWTWTEDVRVERELSSTNKSYVTWLTLVEYRSEKKISKARHMNDILGKLRIFFAELWLSSIMKIGYLWIDESKYWFNLRISRSTPA